MILIFKFSWWHRLICHETLCGYQISDIGYIGYISLWGQIQNWQWKDSSKESPTLQFQCPDIQKPRLYTHRQTSSLILCTVVYRCWDLMNLSRSMSYKILQRTWSPFSKESIYILYYVCMIMTMTMTMTMRRLEWLEWLE